MFSIRPARTTDVPAITKIAQPLIDDRILLGKELVEIFCVRERLHVVKAVKRAVGERERVIV
jgi:amino-acid N-acetyltransferase